jgi:hypothetical protein
MYYKIINKDSLVYKELHEMRSKELNWEIENKQMLKDKIGLKWSKFSGYLGQQTFNRTTDYYGFIFDEPDKVNEKIWKKDKNDIYKPNKRTKLGKEMQTILNSKKGHSFSIVYDILKLEHPCYNFTFPYVEICNDIIILYLDNNALVNNEDIIEITSKEFNEIRSTLT